MFITLKPLAERDASAQQVIARLRPQLDQVQGCACSCRRRRMSAVGGRASARNISSCAGRRHRELNTWSPRILEKLRSCRNCATSPPTSRPTARP
jgi:HAE1 family hydrophobic/amphiphilic exporter-1